MDNDTTIMQFCPPNVTFSHIWVEHGVSRCFMDTVTSATYGLFLFIFGLVQWLMYKRFATPVETFIRPKSRLLAFQLILHGLLAVLTIVYLILLATVIGDKTIYGFELVYFFTNLIVWPLAFRLVLLERHYQLPTVPSNGHGIILLLFWTLAFVAENLTFINLKNEDWWFDLTNLSDKIEFSLFIIRYVTSCLLLVIGFKAPGIAIVRNPLAQPLNSDDSTDQSTGSNSTFRDLFKKLRIIIPYMWPRKNKLLQINVVFCLVLLMLGRVVNVFVPIYNKKIVDALSGEYEPPRFCWEYILAYVGLKFLSGGGIGSMGFLNNLRSMSWISVQQYTSREIQVSLFSHLHSLSMRWHYGRKTGEVLRVMDRGTQSINSLLNYIVFSISPTIIDLTIAVIYFTAAFNIIFGLIVLITMVLYLAATVIVTEWRTKYRRGMNLKDNDQRSKGVDSLLNFETVKYYTAEQYEVERYRTAILDYQSEEWKSSGSLCVLNTIQNIDISLGLLAGSLLCAWYVYKDTMHLTVGDYVLFASYMNQLYSPLNWFGTYYRMIQQNFIDMENMFELMDEELEIEDKPNASTLKVSEGIIEFRDVHFHYMKEKSILNGLSFTVKPGQTLAIVGATGEGKSTILRLLFRFYECTSGMILVDGKDIKEYTQESLRRNIGVVPQDTVLFNDSIFYNIKYGNLECEDHEVETAAKSAEIHEKIINFPDKYDTKVGERGLKLSGGEKQRVAIARTLLKSPALLLLDEATSALDTKTERNIQAALNAVCVGRTVLVVAHRLSTIVNADNIIVLKDGVVAEQGNHESLISQNAIYADMWRQQHESQAKESLNESEENEESVDSLEPVIT